VKYKERDELVAGLRELADFIENNGIGLPITYRMTYTAYVNQYDRDSGNVDEQATKAELQRIAKILGDCQKDYGSYDFTLSKKFGRLVAMKFSGNREAVCEMKIVGYKEVEEREYVVVGKKQEPIYETICKPLLED
jgi:hypothetical protein